MNAAFISRLLKYLKALAELFGESGSTAFYLEFIKKIVAKSPIKLFKFADVPHRSWYVGILPKDRNFEQNFWKFWQDS